MIVLKPTNLHWKGGLDVPSDLCAHSPVDFRVGDTVFVKVDDGDWTVSAAALYLLRTLTSEHTKDNPVCDHLFPCCGHGMFAEDDHADAIICGCNIGLDFTVLHLDSSVIITSHAGTQKTIPYARWRTAVHGFSDAVSEFYKASSPKLLDYYEPYEVAGFKAFIREWTRRRELDEAPLDSISHLPN